MFEAPTPEIVKRPTLVVVSKDIPITSLNTLEFVPVPIPLITPVDVFMPILEFFKAEFALSTFSVGVVERLSNPARMLIASDALNVVLPDFIPVVRLPLVSNPPTALSRPSII